MWYVQKFEISVRGGQYDCWPSGVKKPTYATASPLRWRRSFLPAGLVSHYFPTDTDSFHCDTKQYVWNLRVTRHHSPFAATLSTKSVRDSPLLLTVGVSEAYNDFNRHDVTFSATPLWEPLMSQCRDVLRPSGGLSKLNLTTQQARELFPWSVRITPRNKEPDHRPRVLSGNNWGTVMAMVMNIPLQKRWPNFWLVEQLFTSQRGIRNWIKRALATNTTLNLNGTQPDSFKTHGKCAITR